MLPAERAASAPASLFAALGDPTRLAIVDRLCAGKPRSIAQLSDGLHQTRQGVTKHLKVLQKAGLVASSRVGRESRFTLRPESIQTARGYLDQVAGQWDSALLRLKSFVED